MVQPLLDLSLALHRSHVSDSPPPTPNQANEKSDFSDVCNRLPGARGRIFKEFFKCTKKS